MAGEALDARGAERDAEDFFPLNDLPNELIVSVFAAVGDPTWVRHTFPLVCKAWAALYLTKDASPLHETLVVDFKKDAERENEERRRRVALNPTVAAAQGLAPYRPVVHGSSVISWAQRRAGSVRKLHISFYEAHDEDGEGNLKDFSPEDLVALFAVVGSSLTEIALSFDVCRNKRYEKPFWESLRDSVVPAGRLRSLVVEVIGSALLESDVEPLGQLAGSLEELVLITDNHDLPRQGSDAGLPRFPESLCALKKLRRLVLIGHYEITAIPAGISSLKKLEELELIATEELFSLPKELGDLSGLTRLHLVETYSLVRTPQEEAFPAELEKLKSLRELCLQRSDFKLVPAFVGGLSGLTKLDLEGNGNLENLPEEEAFPAGLKKMKSLRELVLQSCGLRTVPSFVCELESLETLVLLDNDLSSLPKELGELSGLIKLDLRDNKHLGTTAEAFPAGIGKLKSLRELNLRECGLRTVPSFIGELKSLESLDLGRNDLSSLPEELVELSGLTKLDLGGGNRDLENTPPDEAFSAKLRKMKCLREFRFSRCGLRTIPSFVFELKSLEVLKLSNNDFSSLPEELGELSRLTRLDLSFNSKLGTALPSAEAFPAELGKMKSLRELDYRGCGLRTVPSFVGKLESLESLDLRDNFALQIDAPLDFLLEGCPRLRDVRLKKGWRGGGWTPQSLAHLEAFKAKLLAKNPKAKVDFKR